MARENYLRLEAGRVNATIETLLRVAKGMGVQLLVLFDNRRRTRAKHATVAVKRTRKTRKRRTGARTTPPIREQSTAKKAP